MGIRPGALAHERYEHWLGALGQEKKYEQLAQGIGPRCAICMITNEDFVSGIHPLNF